MTDRRALVLGVDVGTQSARAGVFTLSGERLGRGEHDVELWRPEPDHVEQSSADIWRAVAAAVRAAIRQAGVDASEIAGLGFDATCSLVAVGEDGRPVTVSRDGDDARDVVVWMDHRAIDDAAFIDATGHPVLQFVGGQVSPEMQTPKLRWLKRNLPDTWSRTARWYDLADYLTWRATGNEARSLCTTACKWTYLAHEQRWDPTFFDAIGLADVPARAFESIGTDIRMPGSRIGGLGSAAAADLGLDVDTPVAASLIDAHAGALGMIGAAGSDVATENRLAVIAGTSACHLAVSPSRVDVAGVWGPYRSALLPDQWLLEAGLSASGAFLDAALRSHPAAMGRPVTELHDRARHALAGFGADAASTTRRTRHVHWQPNVLGNRAPMADPHLTGGTSGQTLRDDVEDMAVWYLAALQGLAYATRHIIETLGSAGVDVRLLVACGGSATNDWWLRSHADALGLPVAVPAEPDAVLLGAAMLGAGASGRFPSLDHAMRAMTRLGTVVQPDARVASFHHAKYTVYRRMVDDQRAYRSTMQGA
jgi:FGGY-family pentulose kinase